MTEATNIWTATATEIINAVRERGSGSNGTVNALKPSTCPQTSALSGEYDKTTVL